MKTTLTLIPDGRCLDVTSPSVHPVPVTPGQPEQFDVDGQRYRVLTETYFSYLPDSPDGGRGLVLKPIGEPAN